MKKNWRFVYQDNQFWGECQPCTLAVFNNIINLAVVGWKISTRQEVEYAVAHGLPLDKWTMNSDFQQFCLKRDVMPRAGETFRQLSIGLDMFQERGSISCRSSTAAITVVIIPGIRAREHASRKRSCDSEHFQILFGFHILMDI